MVYNCIFARQILRQVLGSNLWAGIPSYPLFCLLFCSLRHQTVQQCPEPTNQDLYFNPPVHCYWARLSYCELTSTFCCNTAVVIDMSSIFWPFLNAVVICKMDSTWFIEFECSAWNIWVPISRETDAQNPGLSHGLWGLNRLTASEDIIIIFILCIERCQKYFKGTSGLSHQCTYGNSAKTTIWIIIVHASTYMTWNWFWEITYRIT